jgi:hypothetical protein
VGVYGVYIYVCVCSWCLRDGRMDRSCGGCGIKNITCTFPPPNTNTKQNQTPPPTKANAASSSFYREWGLRHAFSVHEAFAKIRIQEMFDVVREFPDSLPAVQVGV